ncbi:MAG: hypothetical protein NT124_04790 [Candidatus Dependentiae bacterium]|nr:hypothetical protein [Candidatus Dependentiae bacterium]
MNKKPFTLLDPLKYSLEMMLEQWKRFIAFIITFLAGWAIADQIAFYLCHGSYLWQTTSNSFRGVMPSQGLPDNSIALRLTALLSGSKWSMFDKTNNTWFDPKSVFSSLLELWPILIFIIIFIPLFSMWLEIGLKKTALQIYDTGHANLKTLFSQPLVIALKLAPFFILIGLANVLRIFLPDFIGSQHNTLLSIPVSLRFGSIPLYVVILLPAIAYISFRFAFVALYMLDKNYSLSQAIQRSYHLTGNYNSTFWAYFCSFFCAALFAFGLSAPAFWGAWAIWILCLTEAYMYRKLSENQGPAIDNL